MREAFGNDDALRSALKPVIANCFGGAKAFLDVASFKQVGIVTRPDAGIAIGLELHCNLQPVALRLAGTLLRALNLIGHTRQFLDMMANFVRDDIGCCEITSCAKALRKLTKKFGVEVDAFVRRAIKWPIADCAAPQPDWLFSE